MCHCSVSIKEKLASAMGGGSRPQRKAPLRMFFLRAPLTQMEISNLPWRPHLQRNVDQNRFSVLVHVLVKHSLLNTINGPQRTSCVQGLEQKNLLTLTTKIGRGGGYKQSVKKGSCSSYLVQSTTRFKEVQFNGLVIL